MSNTSPSPSLIESTVAGLLAGVASTVRVAATTWPTLDLTLKARCSSP